MLLQKTPSIEELIVQILAQAGSHSPAEIHSRMLEKGYGYSQRGVYKELNKLEQEGIIYKSGKYFSLQLTWILNLLKFADQAYETSTSQYILKEALRADSFKKVYRFKDLRRLDLFWIQNLMALHQLHQGEPLFLWCPYQWFQLVHSYAVESFYQASDQTSARRYHIIGYDGYLSRIALKSLPKNGTYSFAESPFHQEQSTYYSLIASTVITIKLDDSITGHMSKLFQQVKRENDLVNADVAKLFHAKVRASLTIEKNERKAKKLRKKFTDFFGLS
jgi:DNA-binding transcriptional ArsR family regulator